MNMSRYPRVPLKQMDGAMLAFELFRQIDKVVTDVDENEKVISAAMVATHLHRTQTRMVRANLPRVPYIEHPLRNTLRLVRWGVTDPNTLAACLLHDVGEDCSVEIVEEYMGQDISQMRASLSKDELKAATRGDALRWIAESFNDEIAQMVENVSNPTQPGSDYQTHLSRLAKQVERYGTPVLVGSAFIKSADLADNPGSLIHQYGQVKDSFIVPKVVKYTPAVPVIRQAMSTLPGEAALAATRALINVEHSLGQLSQMIEEKARASQEMIATSQTASLIRKPAPAAAPTSIEDALASLGERWNDDATKNGQAGDEPEL